ncbi:hypothetical protein BJF92_06145 [Rhizobium rhizosphaerae]|uniref:Uncharacterized protein n=1 Tax=Xaviernesmea rhizosphaerae TaxID=1672749 RepID=A0A1Q9AFG6_9HYPH|nr:hypothetical protein [Xaviernesmea rhizosphaerae]OLP53719.1 hypothetical protein BJF92_06145 [Xaviernesmea rhizosphaerae]OQP85212.1 hypothetical protein BTR14_16340 [Xaviernesmea rhizosphaerae]
MDGEARYEYREQGDGDWAVIDRLTGLPAATNGRDLSGLALEDARDIADVLNRSVTDGQRSPLL